MTINKFRKHKRFVINKPCKLIIQNKDLLGLIIDFSLTGMKIKCINSLIKKKEIKIIWSPVPLTKNLNLIAKIKWENHNFFGVKFKELNSQQQFIISRLIYYYSQ